MNIIDKIKTYNLMVRPSLCGNWRCGIWKCVDCNIPSRAFCINETEVERNTLEQVVNDCVEVSKLLRYIY